MIQDPQAGAFDAHEVALRKLGEYALRDYLPETVSWAVRCEDWVADYINDSDLRLRLANGTVILLECYPDLAQKFIEMNETGVPLLLHVQAGQV